MTKGGGDAVDASLTQEIHTRIPQNGQVVADVAPLFATGILPQRDIAHPMMAFYTPVPTIVGQKFISPGPFGSKTGNGVHDFSRGFALGVCRAFDAAHLLHAGPIKMPGQTRAGLQMPLRQTAMTFINRAMLRELCLSLLFDCRGKNAVRTPQRSPLSARVDCPSPRTYSCRRCPRFADINRVGRT
jgi:hypothetical protein